MKRTREKERDMDNFELGRETWLAVDVRVTLNIQGQSSMLRAHVGYD